ncbi:MAG TPA: methylenetetrahydrofolate reductase, partial [Microthrixaceae bacterium]|nr:methylenetetrahydrofolate reductase [Microthrixaceae bacterium]
LLDRGPTLSAEFFPPKTPEGMAQLDRTIEAFEPLDLSFVSVTYGAGGSTRDTTRDIVARVNAEQPYPAMAHLTCMGHTVDEIEILLDDYAARHVFNILALAGDPPADGSPVTGDFNYATELVELVRRRPEFSVGVAAHPELHPRSDGDRVEDRRRLAEKLEVADFAITQFFFDADDYFRMMDDLAAAGSTKPVLPGIMPLVNTTTIRRFAKMNGASFPEEVAARVDEATDADDVIKVAVEAAVELSQRLREGGAPGLHLYSLNRPEATLAIVDALGLRPS